METNCCIPHEYCLVCPAITRAQSSTGSRISIAEGSLGRLKFVDTIALSYMYLFAQNGLPIFTCRQDFVGR